jgi:hypothetical protein
MLLVESLLGSSSAAPTRTYVEDVFSTDIYNGTGAARSVTNNIQLGQGTTTSSWISTLNLSFAYSIALDGAKNVYVGGQATESGTNDFLILKYNQNGILQWQRRLGGVNSDIAYQIGVDSAGNVYAGGTSGDALQVTKYNTSGTIQWQRSIGNVSNEVDGRSLAVDASGNVYVAGFYVDIFSDQQFLWAKYDTSGTLQWQKSRSSSATGLALTVDSSGVPYVAGFLYDNFLDEIDEPLVFKGTTDGDQTWSRRESFSLTTARYTSVAVDSSGNVYTCGFGNDGTRTDVIVVKYNSSGVAQWRRILERGTTGITTGSVATDSSGNVYVCGTNFIVKYDTSGTVLWQRFLTTFSANSIVTDNAGSLYLCGSNAVIKLPDDGTGLGTYSVGSQIFTYSAGNLTSSVSSISGASGGAATLSTTSLPNATSSLTDAAATNTTVTTDLPAGPGKGGLVWMKGRSGATDHALYDTVRGATLDIASNLAAGQTTQTTGLTSFTATGFDIGALAKINTSGAIYTSWTFREQPRFFDVVTYTGTGVARTVAHSLASAPGCIMVKRIDTSGDWQVFHRRWGAANYLVLNSTAGAAAGATRWNSTSPTASVFTVGTDATVNANGGTYVAYLFAHNAGGFGDTGSESIITCDAYTGNGSVSGPTVFLGYEPQWILLKGPSAASWQVVDVRRGFANGGTPAAALAPNSTAAETAANAISPLPDGFQIIGNSAAYNTNGILYAYIAIRRGPMRTPTNGTQVFNPVVYTGTNVDNRLVNTGIAPDMVWVRQRNDTVLGGLVVGDRQLGQNYLLTGSTAVQATAADAFDQQLVSAVEYGSAFSAMNGFWCGNNTTAKLNANTTANNHVVEAFQRAPGFFDSVCYTGTGVNRTVPHNLDVVPELILVKNRGVAGSWQVYGGVASEYLVLDTTAARVTGNTDRWNGTAPTASVFSLGTNATVNASTNTYVAHLFATCPGVSKVGTYTGTGATQTINCGFTGGARFVLTKRIDSTGDWYVWDTARGIVAGNDPYLRTNSTGAEVTTTDWVDAAATGFELSNAGGNLANTNGATYLFLAIA